jgi:hypothetical protein
MTVYPFGASGEGEEAKREWDETCDEAAAAASIDACSDAAIVEPDDTTPAGGASVLCFSVPPNSSEVYFLLGRESDDFRPLVRRCWCDFSGQVEDGEDEETAAARECFEESLSLLCTEQCLGLLCTEQCASLPPRPPAGAAASSKPCDPAAVQARRDGQQQEGQPAGGTRDAKPKPQTGRTAKSKKKRQRKNENKRLRIAQAANHGVHPKNPRAPRRRAAGCSPGPGQDPLLQQAQERIARPRQCPRRPGSLGGGHSVDAIDVFAQALREQRYVLRVRTCLNHGASPDIPRRYHVTFVVRVPWVPSIPQEFEEMRARLVALTECAERVRLLLAEIERDSHPQQQQQQQQETAQSPLGLGGAEANAPPAPSRQHPVATYCEALMRGLPAEPTPPPGRPHDKHPAPQPLCAARPTSAPAQRPAPRDRAGAGAAVPASPAPREQQPRVSLLAFLQQRREAFGPLLSTHRALREALLLAPGAAGAGTPERRSDARARAAVLARLLYALQELDKMRSALPGPLLSHPALRPDATGLPTLRREYVEKDCLQYWSVERLRETLANGGCYRREVFRPSFVPTIAAVIDYLFAKAAEPRRCLLLPAPRDHPHPSPVPGARAAGSAGGSGTAEAGGGAAKAATAATREAATEAGAGTTKTALVCAPRPTLATVVHYTIDCVPTKNEEPPPHGRRHGHPHASRHSPYPHSHPHPYSYHHHQHQHCCSRGGTDCHRPQAADARDGPEPCSISAPALAPNDGGSDSITRHAGKPPQGPMASLAAAANPAASTIHDGHDVADALQHDMRSADRSDGAT